MKASNLLVIAWAKFRASTVVQAVSLGLAVALGATMIGVGTGVSAVKPLAAHDLECEWSPTLSCAEECTFHRSWNGGDDFICWNTRYTVPDPIPEPAPPY